MIQSEFFQAVRADMMGTVQGKKRRCYGFAWAASIYPLFDETALVKSLADQFSVTKRMMESLRDYIDRERFRKTNFVYYNIDSNFRDDQGWDRGKVSDAMRYLFLSGHYPKEFFTALTNEEGSIPGEAKGFMDPFNPAEDFQIISERAIST